MNSCGFQLGRCDLMNSASEGRTLSPMAPFCGRNDRPQTWQLSFRDAVASILLKLMTSAFCLSIPILNEWPAILDWALTEEVDVPLDHSHEEIHPHAEHSGDTSTSRVALSTAILSA